MTCPASVKEAISTGEYDVHEVHVAEQYRMPHQLVGLHFRDNIRRYAILPCKRCPSSRVLVSVCGRILNTPKC